MKLNQLVWALAASAMLGFILLSTGTSRQAQAGMTEPQRLDHSAVKHLPAEPDPAPMAVAAYD